MPSPWAGPREIRQPLSALGWRAGRLASPPISCHPFSTIEFQNHKFGIQS
ncbi:hypothetical protein CNE_1c18830 [Cupriavidus necator N-1]|uniref:Uncharacterized protein n=1 Tax=Cupriavidus necator (strain ATCC 43291 / DSM 13513 / CCUG 52238 / LMG 8453 / N-1) TaxID=1042878 RepID=G0EX50_CUPNN|nr:hypothetical protein CNE_1c18830 [Cupriavidus necator N-1]